MADSCYFIGNSYSGRALACQDGVYALKSRFEHTKVESESSEYKGGAFTILNVMATVLISSCSFYDNSGTLAGVVYSTASSSELRDCTASLCQTPGSGVGRCKGHFCAFFYTKSLTYIRNVVTESAPLGLSSSDDVLSYMFTDRSYSNYVNFTNNWATGKSGSIFQISNNNPDSTMTKYLGGQEHTLKNCQMLNNTANRLTELYMGTRTAEAKTNKVNISCFMCKFNKIVGYEFIASHANSKIYVYESLFFGNRVSGKMPTFPTAGLFELHNCWIETGMSGGQMVEVQEAAQLVTSIPALGKCFPSGTFSSEYENPYERILVIFLLFGTFYLPFY